MMTEIDRWWSERCPPKEGQHQKKKKKKERYFKHAFPQI